MPTVLIVDDDRFTRSVLTSIFAQDPAFSGGRPQVIAAASGAEAIDAFRAQLPQVAVIDLLMPGMDGYAVCEALRAEPGGSEVHLVVMSGVYGDVPTTRRLQDEYRASFFAKPYQLKELTRHVARLLAGDGSPRPDTAEPEVELVFTESRGDLADRPLPAVLLDLHESGATGTLELTRGRIRKAIGLLYGHLVSATSSVREETLGHFLVARGIIDDDQQRIAIKRAAERGERVGEALIAQGAITPEKLVEQLTAQVRHKIVQSLRWPDGAWRFVPAHGRGGAQGNALDLAQVLLSGLRQTVPNAAAAGGTDRLHLEPRGQALLPTLRQVFGRALTEAWRPGVTPAELIGAGVESREVHAAIDALVLCDALRVEPGGEVSVTAPIEMSVEELSEHSQLHRLPAVDEDDEGLYSLLFDDTDLAGPGGQEPLDLGDGIPEAAATADSGYIDVGALAGEAAGARRRLLEEYLRIQGLDHYAVLEVPRDADPATISAAVVERRKRFAMEWFARFDLGRDYAKLEELHAAYDRAFQALLDDANRATYDRELAGGDLGGPAAPSLEAEIGFRTGEELLERGEHAAAVKRFEAAVAEAPNEADYQAALGWARYLHGGRTGVAADAARPHLNQALAINPDHGRAHEYKGLIGAELGTDAVEAITHLERALASDPGRTDAVEVLERLWRERGQLRPLERQYRRLVYRAADRDRRLQSWLWTRLAALHRELGDDGAARTALQSAARLTPGDASVAAQLAELGSGSGRFEERAEVLREHWRRDPTNPGPGRELVRAATQADRHDAAFLAASALVARGQADSDADALYRRFRPRFVVRAQQPLEPGLWRLLRHPDDSPELGAIFQLLAPAIQAAHPLSLADLDVDEAMQAGPDELPAEFSRIAGYVAHMLGVAIPPVYVRPDLGHQIHIGAAAAPVLLVGDEVLRSPERTELVFRLGRAMTYVPLARAVAGSRPSRVLKQFLLAAFADAHPGAPVPDPDGAIAAVRGHLEALAGEARDELRGRVARITGQSSSLNLSAWTRALGSTADRAGLTLGGDLPAAVRFARDTTTGTAIEELIDYAVGPEHLELRAALGVSIDV